MSTRANPTVIGAFVLGAVVLAVAGLLVWGSTTWFETRYRYVMFFDSTVIGLRKGAAVTFRGVRVGDVKDIQVRWGTTMVGVYVSLDTDVLRGVAPKDIPAAIEGAIKAGVRAQLKSESLLTGVLYVALNPFPDTPIVLRGLDKNTPEIPTVPSPIDQWTARLDTIVDAIEALPLNEIAQATVGTLQDTRKTLEDTRTVLRSPEIKSALKNADAVLAETRHLVARVDTLVRDVNAQVSPLSGDARATLQAAQTALADVPKLVDGARRLIVKVDAQADPLLASLLKSSDSAGRALDQARQTLVGVDGTLSQDSVLGYELVQMLRELRETSRALRSLADYLERMPDAPIYGVSRPAAVKGGS